MGLVMIKIFHFCHMNYIAVNYSTVLIIPLVKLRDAFPGSILQPPECGNYFENSERQELNENNLYL